MYPSLDTGGGAADFGSAASGDSGAIYSTTNSGSKSFNFAGNPYLDSKNQDNTTLFVGAALAALLIYRFVK